jgi:hypothetical protein
VAVQQRNDEMVDILKADFVQLNNPAGYWHGHRINVPTGFALEIPEEYQLIIYRAFTINGSLDVQGELVIL